ncbi:MAG: hypothetical protein WBP61_15070 [Nocardioides sp.]
MSARDHRSELVGLLLLALVSAGIVGALVLTDDAAAPAPAAVETGSPAPSPSASEDPPAESEPEPELEEDADPDAILAGDQPFVYACRLVTPDDVTATFGEREPQGYVRQQYLARTPTAAELAGARAFAYGGFTTHCTYGFSDRAGHVLDVAVTQFRSAAAAERRWRGRSVSGQTDLRYLAGSRSFLIRGGEEVLVEVRYAGRGSERALTREQLDWQRPRMAQLAAAVAAHQEDGSAVSGPLPTTIGVAATLGSTPYRDPCSVLTDDVMTALGAPRPEPVVVSTSIIPNAPYGDTAVNSCERHAQRRGAIWSAALEIRYATDPEAAEAIRKRHLRSRYPRSAEITELPTAAGTAYVVRVPKQPDAAVPVAVPVAVHVVVGAHELRLAPIRDISTKRPEGRAPSTRSLVAAVETLAATLRS